jgi:hypothetical protein
MLVRNGRDRYQVPGLSRGLAGEYGNVVKGGFRNRFVGAFPAIFGGYANGHLAPSSFVLPMGSGSISSYTESSAAITQGVVVLTSGLPMSGSSSMVITATNATMSLLAEMIASGALVLSVNSALLSTLQNMIASGSMTLSVLSSTLGGIFSMSASGTLVLTPSVTMEADAFMVATAGGPTPLSPEGLAEAVWNSIAADFNTAGTMGEKLNGAGSAGNPWTEVIESGYSAAELLRLLVAVAAGKTDIIDLGGGLATVKFRDIADSKDRITASMTDSERTTVTRDLT